MRPQRTDFGNILSVRTVMHGPTCQAEARRQSRLIEWLAVQIWSLLA